MAAYIPTVVGIQFFNINLDRGLLEVNDVIKSVSAYNRPTGRMRWLASVHCDEGDNEAMNRSPHIVALNCLYLIERAISA